MSTPAEEQAAQQVRKQRAEQLVEMTANAVAQTRAAISSAGLAAAKVDQMLGRVETDLAELPIQAGAVLQPDNNPRTHLFNAQSYADDIDRNLGFAHEANEEVRSELARSARPLAFAKEFLDELDKLYAEDKAETEQQETGPDAQQETGPDTEPEVELKPPGEEQETTATLRKRLENLEKAVAAANQGVKTTAAWVDSARNSVQTLRYTSVDPQNREAAASKISRAGTEVRNDVEHLKAQPKAAAASHQQADDATRAANELAISVHAGLNPTRPGEATAAGTAVEDPRKPWSEGRPLGPRIER